MSYPHPTAIIEGLYLPNNPDDFVTSPVARLEFSLDLNGIVGSNARHVGNTTLADVRAPSYSKKQDTVLNRQSVSFVGGEDLDFIAAELGLDIYAQNDHERQPDDGPNNSSVHKVRNVLAQCLGANVLLGNFSPTEAIPHFRDLLPGMDFGPHDSETRKFTDATVMITRPNAPCNPPGRKLQEAYPDIPDLAKRFVVAAQGRRGFVGMVAKGGEMALGQHVAFVPFGQR